MSVDQFLLSADTTDLNYPDVRPTLDLNFARTKVLDPRITFTRASGGSYVGADGLIKYAGVNEPRFDHDPATGESLGLLIEEARTNLLLRSEGFDNAYWTKEISSALKVTDTVSPDGLQNAYLFRENSSTGNDIHTIGRNNTYQSGFKYCFSVFVKAYGSGNRKLFMLFGAGAFPSQQNATFDLITGTVSGINTGNGTEARIEKYPNGWYRCTLIGATTISTTTSTSILYLQNGNTLFYPGDGVSGVYIWGAQVEQGSFPTSYIPTQASTRTRAADNVSITGNNFTDFYNRKDSTLFFSGRTGANLNISQVMGGFVRDNTFSTSVYFLKGSSNELAWAPAIAPSNLNIQLISQYSSNSSVKSTLAFSSGPSFAVASLNGNPTITDPNTGIVEDINKLGIGSSPWSIGGASWNGTISRLTYFPKRLPNEQLQALTR